MHFPVSQAWPLLLNFKVCLQEHSKKLLCHPVSPLALWQVFIWEYQIRDIWILNSSIIGLVSGLATFTTQNPVYEISKFNFHLSKISPTIYSLYFIKKKFLHQEIKKSPKKPSWLRKMGRGHIVRILYHTWKTVYNFTSAETRIKVMFFSIKEWRWSWIIGKK